MTYITRHGYTIPNKQELEAQAHPAPITEAASIRGFNYHALLDTVDIRIIGSLMYRPTLKRVPRWEAQAEYMGYKFHINLYQEDIDFLNRVFGLTIGKKTFWRDMLPEALDIGIRYIDKKSRKPVGIKCVWDGSRVVYVDDRYNPFREGSPLAPDTVTIGTVSDVSDTPTHQYNHGGLPSDDYPAEFDWMPPVSQHGIVLPPFKHPRDYQGD